MDVPGPAARLRIYIGENDSHANMPLANALVLKARELGLAGATATRGILGFGPTPPTKPTEVVLSRDLPIVVEIVDSQEMVDAYLVAVQPMIRAGLVTLDTIQVLRYGPPPGKTGGLC